MCLAIPGRLVAVGDDRLATVEIGGVRRRVSLDFVPDARVGDWVTVHVGFAIARLDEAEARETLALLRRLAGAAGDREMLEELGGPEDA